MSKAKAETVKAQCDAEETDGWIYTIKEINAELLPTRSSSFPAVRPPS